MGSLTRRTARPLLVGTIISLALAAVALAAPAGRYKGKTSQQQNVSFRIARGAVQAFKIVMQDTCPDRHTLIVPETYPRMAITGGAFGGRFATQGGRPGTNARLSGKVGRHTVAGSLKDTNYDPREGRLCHGSAKFTARHI